LDQLSSSWCISIIFIEKSVRVLDRQADVWLRKKTAEANPSLTFSIEADSLKEKKVRQLGSRGSGRN